MVLVARPCGRLHGAPGRDAAVRAAPDAPWTRVVLGAVGRRGCGGEEVARCDAPLPRAPCPLRAVTRVCEVDD
jgi:hypothetical protein